METRRPGGTRFETKRVALIERPLWVLSGQLGVVIAVVLGFGARASVKPKVVMLLLICCLAGAVGLGPQRQSIRIVVTAPVVAIITWWMASYLWTRNVYGWWTETQLVIPLVAACVALVGLLPTRQFRGALVVGCYVAIAYTVLELVVHSGAAMVNPDGVPGWRGGFIHKNEMASFMLFAVLVIASFAPRSLRRRLAIWTALGLIAMSQSTSALGTGIVMLFICFFLRRFAASAAPARASQIVGGLCVVLFSVLLLSTTLPAALHLTGKDATLSRRTEVWTGVWQAIKREPWLGYGAGGVWSNPAIDPARSILRNLGFTVFHSHNGLLEVLLVLGTIGLGLYLWLMISTVRLALAHLRHDTETAVFMVGYVILIAMFSISEVVVFGIWLAMLSTFHCLIARIHSQFGPSVHRTTEPAETRTA